MVVKILFLIAAIILTILIFLVSWFWSLLLLPMVVILGFDIVSNLIRKKD